MMAEDIKTPEKKVPAQEQQVPVEQRQESAVERTEASKQERIVSDELRREIELMDLDDNLKKLAEQKAQKIQFYADDDKIKELLKIAQQKGVLVAVQTAKRMNEPYLLDVLHDTLAREGLYKDFTKK